MRGGHEGRADAQAIRLLRRLAVLVLFGLIFSALSFSALIFAQRAFWAAAIFLRAAADMVRDLRVAADLDLLPSRYTFPKAVIAAVTRCSSSSSRTRSFWS
jgi:hypothetical protein